MGTWDIIVLGNFTLGNSLSTDTLERWRVANVARNQLSHPVQHKSITDSAAGQEFEMFLQTRLKETLNGLCILRIRAPKTVPL